MPSVSTATGRQPRREPRLQMVKRLPSEVRDPQMIDEQIVPVEFEKRGEVEQRRQPGGPDRDAAEVAHRRLLIDHSPQDRRHRPDEHLKEHAGERHPQPLLLVWKKPRVAHVAVERREEVNEDETQLVDVSAEVFAGQPVGELVEPAHDDGDQNEGRDAPGGDEALRLRGVVAPVRDHDPDGERRETGDRPDEPPSEKALDPRGDRVEDTIGVEGLELDVQESAPAVPLDGRVALGAGHVAVRRRASGSSRRQSFSSRSTNLSVLSLESGAPSSRSNSPRISSRVVRPSRWAAMKASVVCRRKNRRVTGSLTTNDVSPASPSCVMMRSSRSLGCSLAIFLAAVNDACSMRCAPEEVSL